MIRNVESGLLRGVASTTPAKATTPAAAKGSFASLLAQELRAASPLKFSAHAQTRLQERGIELDESQRARLETAVQQAASKGGRSTLVLLDGVAFVVSVPNRTVVTAVPAGEADDQVFTNIDSTVLAATPDVDASAANDTSQTSGTRLVPNTGSRTAADRPKQPILGDF